MRRHVLRFVPIHDPIANLFYLPRITAADYRAARHAIILPQRDQTPTKLTMPCRRLKTTTAAALIYASAQDLARDLTEP